MASSASRSVDPSSVFCVDCGKRGTKGRNGNGDVYPRAGPGKPRCSKCKQRRDRNGPCPRCDRGMYRGPYGERHCAQCTADPINVVDQFQRGKEAPP